MIEIPEALVLAQQLDETVSGKTIKEVIANQSPHKFAWLSGESDDYNTCLAGGIISSIEAVGGFVDVHVGDTHLIYSEGINLRYLIQGEKLPQKHQLLLEFEDGSYLVGSVQMYGGLWYFEHSTENAYYKQAKSKPSPLSDDFDYNYFTRLIRDEALVKKSVKEVLASKQRIPGLGNGVLQDILFNAGLHPKRRINSLSEADVKVLFESIKGTLLDMRIKGGRDTEKDLFGCAGAYRTKLSKFTNGKACGVCGSVIQKKAYMGGSVYYCETCQAE